MAPQISWGCDACVFHQILRDSKKTKINWKVRKNSSFSVTFVWGPYDPLTSDTSNTGHNFDGYI